MNPRLTALAIAIVTTVSTAAWTQNPDFPSSAGNKTAPEKAPVWIVSHKIGSDHYPMLDRPSMTMPQMSAENGEAPMTENERIAQQQRNRNSKNVAAPIAPGDRPSRDRLRSYTRVIDNAQLVQVVIKNTESKPIKSVNWDFAFPRYETGQLLSRFDVMTNVRVKPGGKKTLKYNLPAGAKKCEVVRVVQDENQPEKTNTFEAVCGKGFHDPSLLKQQQETISIKRIEYADGSIWQRQ